MMEKVSDEEQKVTERIFNLSLSLRLLRQGRWPFHEEAKELIKNQIKKLKSDGSNKPNNQH
jgi:hypothetical protein